MPTIQHAYLLRLWSEVWEKRVLWRSQIDHLQSGRRAAFDTLEELLDYLRRETEGSHPNNREEEG